MVAFLATSSSADDCDPLLGWVGLGGQLFELQKVICSLQPQSLYCEDVLSSLSECINLLTSFGLGLERDLG